MKRFKEGEVHRFTVERETVAPDKSTYYLLSGPGGRKFLLPVLRYSHYGISPGNDILCRIDRINCRGEIFLEPPNPFYTEGNAYSFIVSGLEKRVDPSGEETDVILVSDRFGHINPVAAGRSVDLPKQGTELILTVQRISKGKLFLEHESPEQKEIQLATGRKYYFTIVKTARSISGENCFVVRDRNGNLHTIPMHYYEHYGLKEGSVFRGRVVKIRGNGEKIIEPDNPFYKTGSFMEFRVEKVSANTFNDSFTVFLSDSFGFTHCIEMKTRPESDTIRIRIGRIRKGRPHLKPL